MTIDGYQVECSSGSVLVVKGKGTIVSVLPIGTHAALDFLGKDTKEKIVRWWKSVRQLPGER